MDKALDAVFARLMALTPAQMSERLSAYKNNAFARTLKFLNNDECDVVVSKNDMKINDNPHKSNPVYEEPTDWHCAANDERFALAA